MLHLRIKPILTPHTSYLNLITRYDNAHQAIYNFVSRSGAGKSMLSSHLMIENGSGEVNDPYCCKDCFRTFKQISALMQHSSAKHGSSNGQLKIKF
jgi:hypothetical protein